VGHDDPGQVAHLCGERFPSNEQLLTLMFDISTAGDRIVPLQRVEDLLHGQLEGKKLRRIHDDVELLWLASPDIDLDHAGHGA
jgi:hypothetical protein